MDAGLAISFNGIPLTIGALTFLQSNELKPALQQLDIPNSGAAPTKVKILVGLSGSDPEAAGWYVFCNGRMLLEHDQTVITGWGEGSAYKIPKWHNQYARFRGYVFFDSDDASQLPWNTTKTGVDGDAQVYRAVRLRMMDMMRPVIDFLNRLKEEKSGDSEVEREEGALEAMVQKSPIIPLSKASTQDRFVIPDVPIPRWPPVSTIQYVRPVDQIKKVKKALGATSNREVGEKTFEYYLEMECGD